MSLSSLGICTNESEKRSESRRQQGLKLKEIMLAKKEERYKKECQELDDLEYY